MHCLCSVSECFPGSTHALVIAPDLFGVQPIDGGRLRWRSGVTVHQQNIPTMAHRGKSQATKRKIPSFAVAGIFSVTCVHSNFWEVVHGGVTIKSLFGVKVEIT
jgi:hypothetical protein